MLASLAQPPPTAFGKVGAVMVVVGGKGQEGAAAPAVAVTVATAASGAGVVLASQVGQTNLQ